MHTEPRTQAIEVLVLHDNEGPQGPNAAQNLAGYLQHIDAGYHAIFDNANTVEVAADNLVVWGNGGINHRSLDGCLIGYVSGQWTDPYSVAEIQRAVLWFASKCRAYGIPARHLSPQEVATPGAKGICRHWDVTLAGFPGSAGHTDPGATFPIEQFVVQVANQLAPPKPKVPPMFDPPLQVVARLFRPRGGWWVGYPDGRVDFLGTTSQVVPTGMISAADRKTFAGRTLARLELRSRGLLRRPSFTIVATSGERYIPQQEA